MGQPINDATRPVDIDMARPPLDVYERMAGVYDNGMVTDVSNVRPATDGDEPDGTGDWFARV